MSSVDEKYVILGHVKTLEPVVVSYLKGRGGYIKTLDYIPSTTLLGSIISYLASHGPENQRISYEDFISIYGEVVFTPAYPRRDILTKIEDPLPLPLRTIAKEKKNSSKYISTALLWAKYFDTGNKRILDYLTSLEYKVESGFWYIENNKIVSYSPDKTTYTHVALDYRTRTSLEGYLFTVEALSAGQILVFKACISSKLLDELQQHLPLRLKIGAMKSRGYGLVEIKIDDSMPLEDYIESRLDHIKATDEGYITIDIISEASPQIIQVLSKLGKILYKKIMPEKTKRYYNITFHIIQTLAPGSTIVLKTSKLIKELKNEFSPPIKRTFFTPTIIHINNKIHFTEVK